MEIELTKSGPVLDPENVADFETQHRLTLPIEYRNFLLKTNGGRPKPSVFQIPGQGDDRVRYFFGLGMPDAYMDLAVWIDRTSDRLPPEMLAIASDAFGNLVVLQLAGSEAGRVLFWDHEAEDDEALTQLALTFVDFLSQLREEELS